MNLNQLRYFVELTRSRSFSKAAKNLNISQPALSLQIQNLEEEFNFVLIERSMRPLTLTYEGEQFLEKSLKILQLVDELDNLSIDLEEEVVGKLRVGIIPTLSPYLTPLFIKDISRDYPNLYLEIIELSSDDIISQLTYNEIDLGIMATPVVAKNIGFTTLFYERFFLYVSEKSSIFELEKVRLSDIPKNELWFLKEGNCFQSQVNTLCNIRNDENRQLIYSSYSIESIKRIVELSGGITFIPELSTTNIPSENENMLKMLASPVPVREISAAWLKTSGLKKNARILTDVILSQIPTRMKKRPQNKPTPTSLSY